MIYFAGKITFTINFNETETVRELPVVGSRSILLVVFTFTIDGWVGGMTEGRCLKETNTLTASKQKIDDH